MRDLTVEGLGVNELVALTRIREVAGQIAVDYQPRKIILFGSHAYGHAGPDSDVDLFVIMPFKGNPLRKSVEMVGHLNASIPIDLVVRTPQDVRRRLQWNDFFIKEVMERGVVLYDAANA